MEHFKQINNDFQTLDIEYRTNRTDSEIIAMLNQLDDVSRNIMITYIENDATYTKTAKALNVSVPFVKQQIDEIRNKLKTAYFNIKQ